MNDLTKTNGTALALPDDFADQLAAGIAESRAQTQLKGGGGKPYLTLMKGGGWVWGPDKEEVQPGSLWVVNPVSFVHGWSCWVETASKRELKGDVMDSMARPKPGKPAPIDGQDFSEQRGFELKCITGDDAGTEVQYKNSSDGGVKAAIELSEKLARRLVRENRAYPCPVLELDHEHYPHPKYGRIYKPIFSIVGWADMMGNLEGAPVATPEEAAPEAPAKPRKAPLTRPAAVATAADDVPEPTQRQHTGQRRRPAAR